MYNSSVQTPSFELAEGLGVPNLFRNKYQDQLPRPVRFSWGATLNISGSAASIVGVSLYFSDWWGSLDGDVKSIFFASYLFAIIVFLISYVFIKETSKKHRYAQTIYHIHFVNHAIRDYLAGVRLGRNEPLSAILQDIVNTISSAFSIIEGRQCRCSIKEVTQDPRPQVITKIRDSVSRTQSLNTGQYVHYLDDNTDFENVWNGTEGSVRYYKGVNLKKLWRKECYKNSSFQAYGDPERHDFLGFTWVLNWNLPYNSTVVLPIRYIPDHSFWPPAIGATNPADDPLKKPDIWGFLCIDANSSRVFMSPQSVELGALFADALYTLMKGVAHMPGPPPMAQQPLPTQEGEVSVTHPGNVPSQHSDGQ